MMNLILRSRSIPQWQGSGRDSRIVSIGVDRDVYSFKGMIITYTYDWVVQQWVRTSRPEPDALAIAA